MFIDFRDRGREKEKKREKHQCEIERWIGCLPYAPCQGIKPTTLVCALTSDETCNLLAHRMTPHTTEHTARVEINLQIELKRAVSIKFAHFLFAKMRVLTSELFTC